VVAPFISTNVATWGIDTGKLKFLFFPDAILVYQDGQYEGFAYGTVRVTFSLVRYVEHGPPQDAEIVGHTWQYVNKNGGPDRRYNNRQIPMALYGLVDFILAPKIDLKMQVSNRHLAAQFVQDPNALLGHGTSKDGGQSKQRREEFRGNQKRSGKRRSADGKRSTSSKDSAKVKSAHEILGVDTNASRTEIVAAYRQQAQLYHPDKVANLATEFQELADTRMKEINKAYDELLARPKK
jgi:hypothetical protein